MAGAVAQAIGAVPSFTPLQSLLGGTVIGLCVSAKMALSGRPLGISGTVRGILLGDHAAWRYAFLSGLVLGGVSGVLSVPSLLEPLPSHYPVIRALLAGLMVGYGTSLGNGCTSGHGVTGNARLSPRSMVYTAVFMASGMISATMSDVVGLFALPITTPPLAPLTGTALAVYLALPAIALLTFVVLALVARYGTVRFAEPAAELANGFFFALALMLSGMSKPSKVAGFLAVANPGWDPSLLFVMGGALLVALPFFTWALRCGGLAKPVYGTFCLPPIQGFAASLNDHRLLLGGTLFGAGWGLSGLCPGPAIVGAATLNPAQLAFVAAMLVGMRLEPFISQAPRHPHSPVKATKVPLLEDSCST